MPAGCAVQQCQFAKVVTGPLGVNDNFLAFFITQKYLDRTRDNNEEAVGLITFIDDDGIFLEGARHHVVLEEFQFGGTEPGKYGDVFQHAYYP